MSKGVCYRNLNIPFSKYFSFQIISVTVAINACMHLFRIKECTDFLPLSSTSFYGRFLKMADEEVEKGLLHNIFGLNMSIT